MIEIYGTELRKRELAGHPNFLGTSEVNWRVRTSTTSPTASPTRWDVRDRGPPWNPVTDMCRLCILEKYYIMFEPEGATLNQRSEFFSQCYHKTPLLVKSYFFFNYPSFK